MNFSQPLLWLSLIFGSLSAGGQMELKDSSAQLQKQDRVQQQTASSGSTQDQLPVLRCEPFPECTIWPTGGDSGSSSGG